jgi:hypothetical protein
MNICFEYKNEYKFSVYKVEKWHYLYDRRYSMRTKIFGLSNRAFQGRYDR